MKVFELEVDYDVDSNSPWGELFDDVELEEARPLYEARPLASTWRPMPATLHGAEQHAEFVYFTAGGWAVRPAARRVLKPVLGGAAEFLPLACETGDEFYALHPLQLADLGLNAVARRNEVSGNITDIRRYSFDPSALVGKVCFRVRHPVGSAAGPESGGSDVLVSPAVRDCIERHGFRGVRCVPVFPVDRCVAADGLRGPLIRGVRRCQVNRSSGCRVLPG
jgi:hypothetical protein